MVNDIEKLDLQGIKQVFHNLSYDELLKHEIAKKEGKMTKMGAFPSIPEFLPAEALKISISSNKIQVKNSFRGVKLINLSQTNFSINF